MHFKLRCILAVVLGACSSSTPAADSPHDGAVASNHDGMAAPGHDGAVASGLDAGPHGQAGSGPGSMDMDASHAPGKDAGKDPEPEWAPLTTTATPVCMHAATPAGFDPALIGIFEQESASSYELAALSYQGESLILRCPDQTSPESFNISPDRRKIIFSPKNEYFATSWLLDGVFALPTVIDGLEIRHGYWWINDELLVANAERLSSTGEVLDHAFVVVRWDGTGARRLTGAVKIDNDASSMAFLGATNEYGIYRLDASDQEPGFEYYRVNFADWSTKVLVSGLGGNWVSIWDPFNADTGRVLISGDGHGLDYLYAFDTTSGAVTPLDVAVNSTTAQVSPDGAYAVWPTTNTYESQSLTPADGTTFSYDAINYHSQVSFQFGGHVFASITDDHDLVVVDPATGTLTRVQHAAIEDGAAGVSACAVAPDGRGVFFTAAFAAAGPTAFYYAPLDGAARLLSNAAREASFDAQDPPASHVIFSDGQAIYLADQDGPAVQIPSTEGSVRGRAVGWSRSGRRALVQTTIQDVDGILLWTLGEPTAMNLRNVANAGLGRLTPWSASLLQ